jgi:hypothetical protein
MQIPARLAAVSLSLAALAPFFACGGSDRDKAGFEGAEAGILVDAAPPPDLKGEASTPEIVEAGFATCASIAVEACSRDQALCPPTRSAKAGPRPRT